MSQDIDKVEVARYDLHSSDIPQIREQTVGVLARFARWFATKFGLNVENAGAVGKESGGKLMDWADASVNKVIVEVEKGRADITKAFNESAKLEAERFKLMQEATTSPELAQAQTEKLKEETRALIAERLERNAGPLLQRLREQHGYAEVREVNGQIIFIVGFAYQELNPLDSSKESIT